MLPHEYRLDDRVTNGHDEQYRLAYPRQGCAVLELLGEHDIGGRDTQDGLLVNLLTTHDVVVVDVTETEFIDSSVIATFVRADRLARETESSFRVQVGTVPIVRSALQIAQVLEALVWAESRDAVLASDLARGGTRLRPGPDHSDFEGG